MSEHEKRPELTILMPCLNEENTVGICVDRAAGFLKKNHIDGEILVADNGSSDKSAAIAKKHGARVILVRRTGYGCALRAGMKASRGKIIIMGDCDTTYDFSDIGEMYSLLADDRCDLVIGNRIAEVPVVLYRCGYDRSSKLNAVRDGFRHLRYIVLP